MMTWRFRMDWSRAYSCTCMMHRVDPRTWADMELVGNLVTFGVTRNCTEAVPLIESGSVTVDGRVQGGYYRLSAIVRQGGVERVDIATMLLDDVAPLYGRGVTSTAAAYSVLKPADDMRLPVGSYVPKGSDGPQEAARLLRKCTPAPVTVRGGFILSDNLVLPLGVTYLSAAWTILDAGDYVMQIEGDGTIVIMPRPSQPSLTISRATAGLMMPEVRPDAPTRGVPNRYYAIGSTVAVAVNDDPSSSVSYPSRGRWVDYVDKRPVRIDGESLQGYAERKLRQLTRTTRKVSYTREYADGIRPFSVIRGNLPEWGLDGDMVVASQTIDLSHGIKVQETCFQEVML